MKTSITAIADTREQTPFTFAMPTRRGTLATGDYSLVGIEHLIAVERKSLPDLLACCGHGRDRFKRELQRMRAYPFRLLIVEADFATIEADEWRSQLKPAHVLGALASWTGRFQLPVMLGGTHTACGRFVERFLVCAAKQIASTYAAAQGTSEHIENRPAA